ncbi:unnamed protein product [Prunus brigantina]
MRNGRLTDVLESMVPSFRQPATTQKPGFYILEISRLSGAVVPVQILECGERDLLCLSWLAKSAGTMRMVVFW